MGVIEIFRNISKNFKVCRYPFYKLESFNNQSMPKPLLYSSDAFGDIVKLLEVQPLFWSYHPNLLCKPLT